MNTFWILLIIALVISSIGFYKYVYFISLGYGFSIAGIGIALLILYHGSAGVSGFCRVCCLLCTDAGWAGIFSSVS